MSFTGNSRSFKIALEFLAACVLLIGGAFSGIWIFRTYPDIYATRVWLERDSEISPDEAIVLRFSMPMLAGSLADKIEISDNGRAEFRWSDSNRRLALIPRQNWEVGREYVVSVKGLRNVMLVGSRKQLSFRTVEYPQVAAFFPEKGQSDVVFDIEDPISATFNQPLDGFQVKFVFNPAVDLIHKLGEDNRKIQLIARSELVKGQHYEVEVYLKHEAESDYHESYATSFDTKKPTPIEQWAKDVAERLAQAKEMTYPEVKAGKYIDINTRSQVMVIFENGKPLDSYLISTGRRGMETPSGSFQIRNKFPRAWSKKYALFMPYWMAIVPSGQFGIHELPEWPGGYKEGANHLGIPVSHGCVRLGIGPAQRVYEWAEIGTPVVVHS